MKTCSPVTILMADDDPADVLLTRKALEECRLRNDFHHVRDGRELMAYLRREGKFTEATKSPRPGLILLDLNMPGMDGREALAAIKGDAELRTIPVVVLTTSKADEDVAATYELGANSYIAKPVTFDGLVDVVRTLDHYWFQLVALPG
ncbi:response regulator [Magnetospirillum sp. UT-4]|uniref:response regulator n=1 Tax=Magnetospirillum sp. UT-4 TaxID=2681467 RepID=UPI00137F7032|nr:response regulator [Magnetospirillum sp. UT-4]CAA7613425.1 Response regulator rcp1 [Magnetospirillum sp. UT-4]